jgi:hypothetical protein
VDSSVCSALFFTLCGSCVNRIRCWTSAVAGYVGVGCETHRTRRCGGAREVREPIETRGRVQSVGKIMVISNIYVRFLIE